MPKISTVVTFQSIAKAYNGLQVIKGFDLSIAEGEFLTLLGPSGCGKMLRPVPANSGRVGGGKGLPPYE